MAVSGRVRAHIRSNVVGYVAIFMFAVGGPAYATHGAPDTISSEDIIDGEVKTQDVDNNGIRTADVRDDTLGGGGLIGADIADEAITDADIAASAQFNGAPAGGKLFSDLTGTYPDPHIVENAIGTSEIQPDSLQAFDLSADSVGGSELQNGAVASINVVDGALTDNDLGFNSVGLVEMQDESVGTLEVRDGSLATNDLGLGSVRSSNVLNNDIDEFDIATDGVTGLELDEATVSGLDRCPSPATVRLDRLCAGSDGTNRTWANAGSFCAGLDLRLPTLGEARMLAIGNDVPGVGSSGAFWSDDLVGSFADNAVVVDENGNIDDTSVANSFETVCVIPPFN